MLQQFAINIALALTKNKTNKLLSRLNETQRVCVFVCVRGKENQTRKQFQQKINHFAMDMYTNSVFSSFEIEYQECVY